MTRVSHAYPSTRTDCHRGPSIIGHDDTPLAGMLYPSLSSVSVDSVGLGRRLASLALHLAVMGRESTLG
ncbi:substrate-binding domain-containing protein [Nonomuraea sp. NPDC050383]|uniref:substrate-binding domain-containing protein n=1 Tax=Nonomuraea sp. NPDC050383 TaxID=3364362 RepID=UPI0037A92098